MEVAEKPSEGLEIRDFLRTRISELRAIEFPRSLRSRHEVVYRVSPDFLTRGSRKNKTQIETQVVGSYTGTCLASEGAMQPSQCGSSPTRPRSFILDFDQAQTPAPIAYHQILPLSGARTAALFQVSGRAAFQRRMSFQWRDVPYGRGGSASIAPPVMTASGFV